MFIEKNKKLGLFDITTVLLVIDNTIVSSIDCFIDAKLETLTKAIHKKEGFKKNVIYLESLYTEYHQRNKGFATKLMEYIITKYNDCILTLAVENKNKDKLLPFYKKFGFNIMNSEYFATKLNNICMIKKE